MTLRDFDWNGHVLRLRAEPAARLRLDLDGVPFAELTCDAAGVAAQAFPWSPSGHAQLNLQLHLAASALPLRPVGVRLGRAGLCAAAAPRAPAPLTSAEWLAPGAALRAAAREVAVVVPVYNAPSLVRACLDSVLAHSRGSSCRLIVVDDASPDAAIAPLLDAYAGHARVSLLRNTANRGFTASANRGIEAAGEADVVLLNADAEVAPGWLDGLRRAAWAAADTASATAVSDNAGAFSVPDPEVENALPTGWSFHDAARALRQHAGTAYPRLPTGNGFCLYLKREALQDVGLLDEAAFPQGYGEENDWCQRAEAQGWRHVVAGDVLVRHARSASFGHERRQRLGEAGMAVLRTRWPQYEAAVGVTLASFERRVLSWRVRRAWAGAPPRPRCLDADGERAPDAAFESWRLRRDAPLLHLERFDGSAWCPVDSLVADPAAAEHAAAAWAAESVLLRWLQLHAIERVQGDLGAFGPRLPALCAALGLDLV